MTTGTCIEKNAKIPGHDEDYDDDNNLVENSKMKEQKQPQEQKQHQQQQQHNNAVMVIVDEIDNDHDEQQQQQQEQDKTNNTLSSSGTEEHNEQQKVNSSTISITSTTSFENSNNEKEEEEQIFKDAKQYHYEEKEKEPKQQPQPQQQETQQVTSHQDQSDTTSTTILNTKTSTDDESTASGSVQQQKQQQQQQQQVRRHRHRPDYNDMVERELEDMMMLNHSPSNTSKGGGGINTESTVSGLDSADAIRNYGASILAMADNSRATRQQEKFRRSSSSSAKSSSSGRRSFGGGLTSRTDGSSMISQSLRHLTITSDKDNNDYTKKSKKEEQQQKQKTTTAPSSNKPTIVKLPPPPPTPKEQEQQHQQADDDDTVSSQFLMTPAGSRDQDSQLSDDTTNSNNGMVRAARSMDCSSTLVGTSQKVQQQEQRRHSSSTNTNTKDNNDNDTAGIRRFKVTVNQETLDSIRREQANIERQRQYQEEAAEVARGLTRRVIDGAGTWFENRKERKRRADMERKMEEANRALEEMRRYSTKETTQMIQRKSVDDITRQKDEEEFNVIVVDEPQSKLRTSPPILSKDIMKEFAIKYLPIAVQMGKWKRLYSLSRDGDSFETFINNVSKHSKTLLVVKTTKEDIIGSYVETSWEVTHQHQEAAKFYGSGQSFLFTIVPIDTEDTVNEDDVSFAPPIVNDVSKDSNTNGCSSSTTINTQEEETNNKKQQQQQQKRRIVVYKWTGLNRYIQLCDGSRKLIALGGGGNRGTFGLCLEDDFSVGSSGPCETFGNTKPLSSEETFDILDLEVWGIFSYAF